MPFLPSFDETSVAMLMTRGTQLHQEGQLELALLAFEQALQQQPDNLDAACASATLLSTLSRPAAAYQALRAAKTSLWMQAEGAANLAIAAENCGYIAEAKSAYQRALELDPSHLRSLNNMGLMAAADSNWAEAIELARRCVALDADDASYRQNLSDHLSGARRYGEALDVLNDAAERFSEYIDITIRRIIVLAFKGDFEQSRQLQATLDIEGQHHLQTFLSRAPTGHIPALPGGKSALVMRDAFELYTWQAFEAMKVCDWHGNDALKANLRDVGAGKLQTAMRMDGLDVAFYAHMLAMDGDELDALHGLHTDRDVLAARAKIPAFTTSRKTVSRQQDPRIHVGLVAHQLHDTRRLDALTRQLALHDKSHFAIHVYSSTQQPAMNQLLTLQPHATSVVQIAHLSDLELAARIRLDQLDVFVDLDSEPGTPRPEIADMRVAPVQVCQTSWQRHRQSGPYEYTLSDRFVHPDGERTEASGTLARLPLTCWLALHDAEPPVESTSRHDLGLAPQALVLCAVFEPVKLDPATFAVWMGILQSLPDAVLWLPGCHPVVQENLSNEAQAAGVQASQLAFSGAMGHQHMMASLQHADLFLDTMRCSAVQSLEQALRVGVPAISCAGSAMASRLGGSLLRAAGFAECVFDTPQAYAAEVVRLAHNPAELKALRERFSAAQASAPLFDVATRVKELETAWTAMVERSRAGLPPATFHTADFKLS